MELMVKAMKVKVGNPLRKLVLLKLADNASDQGECWPSYQHIADQCEISRRSVIAHIKALEKSGFLKINNRKSTNSSKLNASNLFVLTLDKGGESPALGSESPAPAGESPAPGGESPALGGGESPAPRTSHSLEPVNEPNTSSTNAAKENRVKATDEDYALANFILEGVRRLQPKFKPPNLDRWADDCRKLRELDNRSLREIARVFTWANNDNFWQSNILSPAKLRKQFDQLQIKSSQSKGSANENHNSGPGNRLQQEHAQINAAFARASAREAAAGPVEAHDPTVRPQVVVPARSVRLRSG
ncbi:helix-turn-helix domain-containing protein [uncultured Microbulbifer sp.]|uniref:helix-turn-helix domain-containing protein n=1 Tax=uncultured Microbulbifer sp. TaxID=348147 RepID=UPI002617DC6E|nr:helix-turn-helix domain-containing protein [uncultured Microbulbifer sp.]